MNTQILKYATVVTVAAGVAYTGYKYGRKLFNDVKAKPEVKEPSHKSKEEVKDEAEDTVRQVKAVEEAIVVEETMVVEEVYDMTEELNSKMVNSEATITEILKAIELSAQEGMCGNFRQYANAFTERVYTGEVTPEGLVIVIHMSTNINVKTFDWQGFGFNGVILQVINKTVAEIDQTIKTAENIVKSMMNHKESEESETVDMIESDEEIVDEVIVNEPTALEDVILCFTKLLLLEDEGIEIQDKLNEYCDLILTLKRAKGLNTKAFKAIVKRVGVQPNSREWSRLFSDLKHYEATQASYEELN